MGIERPVPTSTRGAIGETELEGARVLTDSPHPNRVPTVVTAGSERNPMVDPLSDGRPMSFSPLAEIGATGLKHAAGFLQEEFVPDLRGVQGMEIYREMRDQSPTVAGMLMAIEMPIRQMDFRVESLGKDLESRKASFLVDSSMNDMDFTWADFLTDMLSMLTFGWAWHELVYKLRDGDVNDPTARSKHSDHMLGWRRIPIRAQESMLRWEIAMNGDILAYQQIPAPDYTLRTIPAAKSIHFRTRADKNSPEGRSLLRPAYWSWYQIKRLTEIEGIGHERNLGGFPVMDVPLDLLLPNPSGNNLALRNALQQMVRDIKVDEQMGALIPSERDDKNNRIYDLRLLSAQGSTSGAHNVGDSIKRHQQDMTMSMLADFILIGHSAVGSRALADPKMDFFMLAVNALADTFCETFNRQAIDPLLRLNNIHPPKRPRLTHGEAKAPQLNDIGAYLKNLADAGMPLFPNPQLEGYLMNLAHFPIATPSEAYDIPTSTEGFENDQDTGGRNAKPLQPAEAQHQDAERQRGAGVALSERLRRPWPRTGTDLRTEIRKHLRAGNIDKAVAVVQDAASMLKKFDPNHGAHGYFASAGSGSSGRSPSSRSARNRTAYATARTTGYPVATRAGREGKVGGQPGPASIAEHWKISATGKKTRVANPKAPKKGKGKKGPKPKKPKAPKAKKPKKAPKAHGPKVRVHVKDS